MKICKNTDCKQINPQSVAEFYADPHGKDGLKSRCRSCYCAEQKKYRMEDPEHSRAIRRKAARKNPEKGRDRDYRNRYGITIAQYNQIFVDQNGVCAICKQPETDTGKRLAVDHDHSSKIVRGLLCGKCNKALGLLKDSKELLISAMRYLDHV